MAPKLKLMGKPASRSDGQAARLVSRAQAADDALASVRAEGLDPGRAEPLLAAWKRGELTDEQLEQLSHRLLHDRDVTVEELLAGVHVA